jgi:hypothetical protein
VALEDLKVIALNTAFELVFDVLKENKLSTRDESMLEALVLACPQITDGSDTYILRDDLNNFCRNFIQALKENDGNFLYKEKGYKGRLVDVEEFIESKEYMAQKGSVRPVVKYELQTIVEKIDNTREVVLTGCVSGDTVLSISRQRRNKFVGLPMTIKDLYHRFHSPSARMDMTIPFSTLSLLGDSVGGNVIENVFFNGKKKVYLVTTNFGKTIKCTLDHKFKIPGDVSAFMPIRDIGIGGTIICRATKKKAEGRKKRNQNRKCTYSVPFHPYARKHLIAGKNYKRIYHARITIEAALNNLSEEQFINILRTDEKEASLLRYSNPKEIIHHINGNEADDSLENLVLLSKRDHDKYHGTYLAKNIGNCEIHEEIIESIDYIGEEDTYDLEMKGPFKNYVQHTGIITHNSTGWGKSYLSRLLISYILYKLSMLHNPQYQYGLAPGSSIVMILQSLSLRLSKKILFDPLLSAFSASPYFIKNFPFNKQVTSELQFPKNIYILPVSGSEMATLGLDVYAGIMSELNYFSVVENSKQLTMRGQEDTTYDQASNAYTNLIQRLKSRFQTYGKIPGCLILDSAVHYPGDFLSKKIEEAKWDNQIYVVKHAIWDTLSADRFSGKKFLVEIGTLDRSSRILESKEFAIPEAELLEVPEEYRSDFDRDIETALRDFAGLATGHRRAFMPFKESVVDAYTVYEAYYGGHTLFTEESFVLNDYFVGPYEWDLLINKSYMKQVAFDKNAAFAMHVDLGISKDCVGLSVGHIQEYKSLPSTSFYSKESNDFTEVLNMDAPVICIDGMMQIRPPQGGEIDVDMLLGLMLYLCNLLNMKIVTMDTYQNVSFIQGLRKMKVRSGPLSTVTTPVPYMELKSSYIEGRIIHQKHDIYIDELLFLEYDPKKNRVEHLPNKGKDVSDANAGMVHILTHKIASYKRSRRDAKVTDKVPAHRQIVINKL